MSRFCYCSKVVPGKTDRIREHWKNNPETIQEKIVFWPEVQLTGFHAWLQPTSQGDFMIHCLEGESLDAIFTSLRELIAQKNSTALGLWTYYKEVLGRDYSEASTQPTLECLLDVSLPNSAPIVKKAFMYPLLPEKVEAHRQFRKDASGAGRARHEASMRAFGVSRLTTWLQTSPIGPYCIVYTERAPNNEQSAAKRLEAGNSPQWQEIAATLQDHTGLSYTELSPNVEWLTKPQEE